MTVKKDTVSTVGVLTIIAVAASVFFTTAMRAVVYAAVEPEVETAAIWTLTTAPTPSESETFVSTSPPTRIVIPAIKVDAEIEQVGIAESGNMAVPASYGRVGWYRLGTVPGNTGSAAVMAGHVTNGLRMPGVFFKLGELVEGDSIFIENSEGVRLHFTVTEIGRYPYDTAPLDRIFNTGTGDTARLNLITCDGVWIPSERTYDHRIVVYTELTETLSTR